MGRKKRALINTLLLSLFLSTVASYADWKVYEETTISSKISGSIKKGFIFQTRSGNLYEVAEYLYLHEYEYSPRVVVLTDGYQYRLLIDGFDNPILCVLLSSSPSSGGGDNALSGQTLSQGPSLESRIVSEFCGLDHGNVYRLANGQVWQQTEYWKWMWTWHNPAVLIWQDGGLFKMKVENIEHAVMVNRIR